MRYAILEGNMDRLEKKLNRIGNKCRKFGCDFRFERVGEEFREISIDDDTFNARFIIIEVEGKARVNGWRFLASVEHTGKGNIINRVDPEIEVPERYYDSDPICEHCGTNRRRKDTYIVYNETTGEFKQVGKSCLQDFTGGLSAEGITAYISAFDEVIKGEAPSEGCYIRRYVNVREFLGYAAETIRHFGYVKKDPGRRSTADRVISYYACDHGWLSGFWSYDERRRSEAEMRACKFDAASAEATSEVERALAWLNAHEDNSNYMHNLKVACALEYDSNNYGILVSLFPTYNRELALEDERRAKEAERLAKLEAEKSSEWVGEVGDKISINVREHKPVTSWESNYGMVFIYKIIDTAGNVFTWKTSKMLPERVERIAGTVKEHKEYRGI